MTTHNQRQSFALITVVLPGPDRKRTPAPYHFRVTYRNPDPTEPGCVMTWEVSAAARSIRSRSSGPTTGELLWHCTCPDAVYPTATTATPTAASTSTG